MEREAAGEEEEKTESEAVVNATLEEDSTTADAAASPRGGKAAKKGKKKAKKKAKKKPAADLLDLDMDSDDASQQTRFAGVMKQQNAAAAGQEDQSNSMGEADGTAKPSPRHSKKRRSSTRAGGANKPGGLSELVEVDEEESGSSDGDDGEGKE